MKRAGALILVLSIVLGTASTVFAKKHDMQYWHTDGITYKIDKDWKVTFGEEGYLNDTASHAWYQELDLGVVYSDIAKWLDVSLNYKYSITEIKNRWFRQDRPHINATLKYTIKGFNISDRNRIEYRIKENAEETWYYRNLLTVKFPFKFTAKEIQPYIADEILVDFDRRQLSENRGYAGFTFKIAKNLSADVYYMKWRVKPASISYSDIVGTRFNYSF
ncbi:MAG: hypothetical protein AUJ74_05230 [Candidatus Omnitrophica bacterium CG1_02_44_16]|nr:MAG: hypothetical protein AUJ74_05230 [Candidatus Omnitrophica bacterium CG1_02_44_16]PIY83614.1 MAG: hypothetical protein COY78_01130 [Candidatus Omnitrophica bacterium CG_4_10_14_0_8_um_filter_44_12]PIZ83617.1 MAG: hypothetical protein COX96_07315 [Candidatus Omnitrophica bacterium CG_4_10_14_0_2_um_filter_44_9]